MKEMLRKSAIVAAALCVLALLPPAHAQDAPAGAAGPCLRAQQALSAAKAELGFPGAVGAVNLDSGEECAFAVGIEDLGRQAPMTPEHRILAASIGKTFVAAEVVRLSFAGVLGIDDKVARWLGDEEGYARIPNAGGMTIRQLLSHTAGIPDHVYKEAFFRDWSVLSSKDSAIPPWQLVSYIFDSEPLFSPGQGFAYTDTGYILLGLLIEKASGEAFYDLVQRDFLGPLGLARTSPTTPPRLANLAQAYIEGERLEMAQKEVKDEAGYLRYNAASEWAGGGFVSGAGDLARWVKAHFSGRSMPYDYLGLVIDGAPRQEAAAGKRYGLGVAVHATPFGVAYGHTGWIPGYVSAAFYVPAKGTSYAFSINTDIKLMGGPESHFSRVHERFLEAVFR